MGGEEEEEAAVTSVAATVAGRELCADLPFGVPEGIFRVGFGLLGGT